MLRFGMADAAEATTPAWVLVVLFALWFAFTGVREWFAYRRETDRDRHESELRRRLGACRTALEACEIQRDAHRKVTEGQRVTIAALQHELGNYRKLMPPDMRLTRVLVGDGEPEGE